MKSNKVPRLLYIIIFTIFLTGCSSITEKMFVFHVERSLNPVIIPYRSTEKEMREFFGKPDFVISKKNRFYGITYYNGSYYLKNTEEHKKILKKLLPEKVLKREDELKETILTIYFDPVDRVVSKYGIRKYMAPPEYDPNALTPEEKEEMEAKEKKLRDEFRDLSPLEVLNKIILDM